VGNLPYAITSPILDWAVRHRHGFAWAALMMQREVAARLLAGPDSGNYGSLTVWVGYHFRVEKEMAVGAANFWPMPKVESAVVRLRPHAAPPVEVPSARALERVVRAAFSHRRKMIAGSLSRGMEVERAAVEGALREAGIDPRRRAESCSLEEFAALTRCLWAAGVTGGRGPVEAEGVTGGRGPGEGEEA
jgi:16S rRNA (adenine1518-N6/adenine1519-N6)-dimethyltransferase